MYSRKLALSLAKQYRTCPPDKVRTDAYHKESLKRHLAICPYCSTQQMKGQDPWEKLASKLKKIHSLARSPAIDKQIIEGQLRPVMSALGKWRKGYYYNPPLVLVLEIRKTISDDILVAQTYHDIYLAGPGDLILMEEKSPAGPLFVQPWNTYTLRACNLDPTLEQFPAEIVKAVRALENDPAAYPAWAMQPRPFTQNDARIYFRQLEVDVGYIFSVQAVEELMTELEGQGLSLVYSSNEELRHSIRKTVPGIYWSREASTLEETLTLAHFPPEQLRLAASETDRRKFTANLIVVEHGRVKRFEPLPLVIFAWEMDDPDHLTIDGRVLEIPENLKGIGFLCFLLPEKGKPIIPAERQWDENSGSFLVKFEAVREIEGRLAVAVVFTLSEE